MRFLKLPHNRRLVVVLAAMALALVALVAGLAMTGYGTNPDAAQQPKTVHVDQIARLAKQGEVESLSLAGDVVTAKLDDGSLLLSRKESQVSILETLRNYGVSDEQLLAIDLEIKDPAASSGRSATWAVAVVTLASVVFIVTLILISSKAGGAGRYGSFTRSGARVSRSNSERSSLAPTVTFKEVAGVEEAKEELQEVVEFLKSPRKFTALGATIPKGVLLVGPPGTGKTLLAKAVAGEAGVPFFSISGSEFVEMFVGVGASRVRDLFNRARKAAPCIVFIDEIDAVGRHRGSGVRAGGGHDEREQTLNQILVEMDGFDGRTGVVVIAATNRPDVLDEALLRPGRFDRQVVVDSPDLRGRRAILAIHSRGKPLAKDVDLDTLARQTPGFSGADLANLMNEAAIQAARRGRRTITRADVEEATDRCIAGPQRKSRILSQRERRVTAYHEIGHALVAHALPNCDQVHKVTVIGRGRAGGFTQFLPPEDRSLWTRSQFMDTLASMLGGHAAEELVFGEVTTGASNDIERATELAQRMVCQYGMSDRLGPLALGRAESSHLGRGAFEQRSFSDQMAREVDQEIRKVIDEARMKAKRLLAERREKLEALSELLLERETLTGEEFRKLADAPEAEPRGKPLPEPVPQPVAELQAEPVEASRGKAPALQRVSAGGLRLAKRLRLRPKSVLTAMNDRKDRLFRKASEALEGERPEMA